MPASPPTLNARRYPLSPMPSSTASFLAAVNMRVMTGLCSPRISFAVGMCSLGIIMKCTGARGLISRIAKTRSSSYSGSVGISPSTIRQNRQSGIVSSLPRRRNLTNFRRWPSRPASQRHTSPLGRRINTKTQRDSMGIDDTGSRRASVSLRFESSLLLAVPEVTKRFVEGLRVRGRLRDIDGPIVVEELERQREVPSFRAGAELAVRLECVRQERRGVHQDVHRYGRCEVVREESFVNAAAATERTQRVFHQTRQVRRDPQARVCLTVHRRITQVLHVSANRFDQRVEVERRMAFEQVTEGPGVLAEVVDGSGDPAGRAAVDVEVVADDEHLERPELAEVEERLVPAGHLHRHVDALGGSVREITVRAEGEAAEVHLEGEPRLDGLDVVFEPVYGGAQRCRGVRDQKLGIDRFVGRLLGATAAGCHRRDDESGAEQGENFSHCRLLGLREKLPLLGGCLSRRRYMGEVEVEYTRQGASTERVKFVDPRFQRDL